MADVIFFEKPGCINNNRQKALLAAAGHRVITRNLLTEPWTPERLLPFLKARPVADWFNRSAPQIRSGEVNPERFGFHLALVMLAKTPLLIRRPLMQVGDECMVGFDAEAVERWIGLKSKAKTLDLEVCPRSEVKAAKEKELVSCP